MAVCKQPETGTAPEAEYMVVCCLGGLRISPLHASRFPIFHFHFLLSVVSERAAVLVVCLSDIGSVYATLQRWGALGGRRKDKWSRRQPEPLKRPLAATSVVETRKRSRQIAKSPNRRVALHEANW